MAIFKKNVKKQRVIVYVDGFNLYFGMTSKYKKIKWLDLLSLSKELLKPHQELVEVKYFTARIKKDPLKQKRQSTYIDALEDSGVKIIPGKYLSKPKICFNCGSKWKSNEEKMTDVNISVSLIIDAMNNRYDKAILISGDSDLAPPIKAVHDNFNNKHVIVFFPPNRANKAIQKVARSSFVLGRKNLSDNQFKEKITLKNGVEIEIPNEWK
ncbi:NYN domain-containing protein [Aestuariivivens insulae]|uniref:NYN domain-containing protein n=1 Tax=Aestuariivivens insulae TaxID=1621988 RepID=UPI001F5A1D65|nr:NYN domain-containing protein [Aestuariivivens insulae]